MRCAAIRSLFARQDSVEVAWEIVDRMLASGSQADAYASGTWGPEAAASMVERYGGWYDPPATGAADCN